MLRSVRARQSIKLFSNGRLEFIQPNHFPHGSGDRRCTSKLTTNSHSHSDSPTVGLFGNPLLFEPHGFKVAADKTREASDAIVAEILRENDIETVISLFDELSDTLCRTADLAECIRLVHPDQEYIKQATLCCSLIGNYVEELNTHRGLHKALRRVTSLSYKCDDKVMQQNIDSLMHDFEISGIHLSGADRERVVDLNAQILSLGHAFINNCSQPVAVNKNMCPAVMKALYPEEGDNVLITNVPYTNPDPLVRSAGYILYHHSAPQQIQLLELLLALRHELASLVGYPTFAHRALKNTTAQTPETVIEFLNSVTEKILPLAKEEVQEMISLKQTLGELTDLNVLRPWDITIVTRIAQQNLFPQLQICNMDEYFSLESCLAGLNNIFQSLFGVTLQPATVYSGELWHSTVRKYSFIDTNGHLLGILYCDFFDRPEKSASDCQFTIQGGRKQRNGSYQTPIVTLSLSLPIGDPDPFLSQPATENLFHEMGHALHSVLGRTKYQNVSGTRCSTDYAEVHSNLMEMFLRDRRVLSSFAHNSLDQPLPLNLAKAFQCSANVFPAFHAQMQILYAMMDQEFHGQHPLKKPISQIFADLHNSYAPIQHIPNTSWFLRFNHLYSYAAKYYSYPWAQAVAALIWKHCFSANPFSSEMGARYRNMLSYGGGCRPDVLVTEMLGFSPSVSDLVEAYVTEVKNQKDMLACVNRT